MPQCAINCHAIPKRTLQIRRAQFDRIANPLWMAIARGDHRETAMLQAALQHYVSRHPGGVYAPQQPGGFSES